MFALLLKELSYSLGPSRLNRSKIILGHWGQRLNSEKVKYYNYKSIKTCGTSLNMDLFRHDSCLAG